jgi:hypothetical protein
MHYCDVCGDVIRHDCYFTTSDPPSQEWLGVCRCANRKRRWHSVTGESPWHLEFDANLVAWWVSLEPSEREVAVRRPISDPMPRWMVRTLRRSGVVGVVESPVSPDLVGPWFAVPAAVKEFLAVQREQWASRSDRAG